MRTYGTGSIRRKGRLWYMRYYTGGQQYEAATGCDNRKAAEKVLRDRLAQIDRGEFVAPGGKHTTVADVCELVFLDYELHKKRSTGDVRRRIEGHVGPALGNVAAIELADRHIAEYIRLRRAAKATDSTINRELAIVRRGYTLAVRRKMVTISPYIPKLDESGNARQGFLEPEQYIAVLKEMPEHLKCLFICDYHLGMRLGELRKLRWEQVDLDARQIRLEATQTKGKKARTAPIYGDMLASLQSQKAWRDEWFPECPWVFHYVGRQIGTHVKGWNEACTRAGLKGLLRHDLRRTAVRNMVRAGVPETVARAISGHRTRSVFDRYDIVSGRDIAEAGEQTERYLAAQLQDKSREDRGKSVSSFPSRLS